MVDGFSNYIMRPNEHCWNYMGCHGQITDVLDEAYDSYHVIQDRPQEMPQEASTIKAP